jgi:hypothetical protein
VKHATVKIGEYTIPLLGIPQDASEQICDQCKLPKHITEVAFDGKQFICGDCLKGSAKKKRAGKKLTRDAK